VNEEASGVVALPKVMLIYFEGCPIGALLLNISNKLSTGLVAAIRSHFDS
jgi:hypothetical protein